MSQTATLYRISGDIFEQLKTSGNARKFKIDTAKSYETFAGSFMALEYLLSKGKDQTTADLFKQIFDPTEILGKAELERLPPEEQFEFYESGSLIPYLHPDTIMKINSQLEKITGADIEAIYDADELNRGDIYPSVWHNNNSPDLAYNKRQLIEDFTALKKIYQEATGNRDFLLVFVG